MKYQSSFYAALVVIFCGTCRAYPGFGIVVVNIDDDQLMDAFTADPKSLEQVQYIEDKKGFIRSRIDDIGIELIDVVPIE
jgi:hypothetical protein